VALAREVIPELEQLADDVVLVRAWQLKSGGDYSACRWREYEESLEQALVHARRANASPPRIGRLYAQLAQAMLYGPTRIPEAITRIEEMLQAAGSDRALRVWFDAILAGLRAMRGEFEEARRLSAEAVATLEALGQRRNQAEHAYISANIELLAGDPEAAEREFRTSREALDAYGAPSATMGAMLADVLCTLGRLDEAEALAREAADAGAQDHLVKRVVSRTALARVLARRDELDEAARLAGEALALTDDVEFPSLRVMALTAAAEVAEADGRAANARGLLEQAREILEAKGNLVMLERLEAALTSPVR
jgi:ATP/maltotriose-dependent transcriptional regulator MalT